MYCEGCNVVFNGNECPNCGNKRVRNPVDHDLCFLVEKEAIWGEMLADTLKQKGIPFYHKNVLGTGFALRAGSKFERYKFYVPYSHLSSAKSIVDDLFTTE
jgi:hypothetical protein